MSNIRQEDAPNIDSTTGIEKDVLSTHHSRESLDALKECKDDGVKVRELLSKDYATDEDIDKELANYTESLSLYLATHAEQEYGSGDKFTLLHGEDLKKRADAMQRMSENFLSGKPGPDEIQFLYSMKVAIEAEKAHCSRLISYIDHKKKFI